MTRKLGRRDPLEAVMESALQPGRFIGHRAGWEFVSGLEDVAGQLEKLAPPDPERAVTLYETFLAGCYAKADEVDDSSGAFGTFVVNLYCGWIKAREAARADADATATWLLDRMDNDPYGFASPLAHDAVTMMRRNSLAALERQVKARFDATGGAGVHRLDIDAPCGDSVRGSRRSVHAETAAADRRRGERRRRSGIVSPLGYRIVRFGAPFELSPRGVKERPTEPLP